MDSTEVVRILHTSDWHLGKEVIRESTIDMDRKMLEWILSLCRERSVDCLLISGDVFDVAMPSNEAQRLYYSFLSRLLEAGCRRVVVTPGNHDSANFLRAPAAMLSQLGIVVPGPDPESEAVVIRDDSGVPLLGIGAVPFLRESEVRLSLEGMTDGERWALYEKGVRAHYARVREALDARLAGAAVPRVAMGHFFALGTSITPDPETGEVPQTVGTLGAISPDVVGDGWDYVALSHIHRAQTVGRENIRYSGSPQPLSFREVKNENQVVLVTLEEGKAPDIEPVYVPRFQPMERLEGDVDGICAAMERVAREEPGAWIEANYTGVTEQPDLTEKLQELALARGLKLLAVRNQAAFRYALSKTALSQSLEEMEPEDVFRQLLTECHKEEAARKRLMETFEEALAIVRVNEAGKDRDEDSSPSDVKNGPETAE